MTFTERLPIEVEERQSFLIKKFDTNQERAKVMAAFVSLGEIILWFPTVYWYESQEAKASNSRIVIVVPSRFECLVERFPCSWRIVVKDLYHLSMIAHRHNRLKDDTGRYPKPEGWEENASILIEELQSLLTSIVQGLAKMIFMTDFHTFGPAMPPSGHWALNDYWNTDHYDSRSSLIFTPAQRVLKSFPHDWGQYERPFVGIHTYGSVDRSRCWRYWNEFLGVMEREFRGTVFRIGAFDDEKVELEPRSNFVDLCQTHSTVEPQVAQINNMNFFVGAYGGMACLAQSQQIPSLIFFDAFGREQYNPPGYEGVYELEGRGIANVKHLLADAFDNISPKEFFRKFQEMI